MGLLGDVYSYGDTLKRKVGGLLSDPRGTLEQFVGQLGDDMNTNISNMKTGYGFGGNKSVLSDPAQVQAAQRALADYGAQSGMAAATVWHGSPHKFDKFDSSKIGTGEGAQAYGHGLYLAESDKVAGEYANMFAKSPASPAQLLKLRDAAPKGGAEWSHYDDLVKNGQGFLYKVDLPDEHIAKMLDWDKPLSQQHPDVQAVLLKHPDVLDQIQKSEAQRVLLNERSPMRLDKIPSASIPYDASRMTGKDALTAIQQRSALGKTGGVEEQLRKAGIPGIRYLDGGSRGAGQGSSNFVVFPGNEGMLQILERNNKALDIFKDTTWEPPLFPDTTR